jgi:type I restriction enzyme S subunit
MYSQATKKATGTAQKTVGLASLRSFFTSCCSKEEQHQIVREIESRLSVCDKVEQSITESLEKAKALRQSILKKAFDGTLLSEEEIAACKAAPDYEPASVLLERIKREKS